MMALPIGSREAEVGCDSKEFTRRGVMPKATSMWCMAGGRLGVEQGGEAWSEVWWCGAKGVHVLRVPCEDGRVCVCCVCQSKTVSSRIVSVNGIHIRSIWNLATTTHDSHTAPAETKLGAAHTPPLRACPCATATVSTAVLHLQPSPFQHLTYSSLPHAIRLYKLQGTLRINKH